MIKLTILGNNSALPAHGRHPTAQIVDMSGELFLMDCGEGTQIQMQRYQIKKSRIQHIFISHLHGDHYYGLVGLITSMGLTGRTAPLHIYCPIGLKEIILQHFQLPQTEHPYALLFHEIEPGQKGVLIDEDHYEVRCFPVEHRIPCHGFAFVKRSKSRKINAPECQKYEVPLPFYNELKRGADYITEGGQLILNEALTLPPDPPKSYVYCADTRFTTSFLSEIENADLLYHESTFLKIDEEKAINRFHSTAEQAAQLAQLANAKRLLLGHYSSRYQDLNAFYDEASTVFPNVEVSREGMTYEI